jgi:outer membrane protein OmpA-like peptidoglycan-associated protein
LLQRGQYSRLANPLSLKPDKKTPLEIYEARNAVQIARAVGADRFAAETFQKAEKSLAQAEAYQGRNAGSKPTTMMAREAVQMAEDSRGIAVKRQEEDALTAERQDSMDREKRAENGRAAAQAETSRIARDADEARARAQADSDRVKRENDTRMAANAADADRLRLANEARMAATAADADRLRLANEARMASAAADADRLKQENEAQRMATQAALDRASQDRAQSEKEKSDLRVQLLAQFSAVLQTRDTARGLIVNMSDVLFDTGKFSLRPLAREKLAKVAGIVSGHPGLRLDVEGYTDSVGGDDYNQKLSEDRGEAVRSYLTQQGMAGGSVTSKGFGKTQPVASNDTAQGRQQNRRVELVISGEVIGTAIGTPIAKR